MGSVEAPARAKRLILLGPPGSGKSTQAKILAGNLGVEPVASGDLFRSHQQQGTPLGIKAAEYMSQGLLVPDEVTIAMVLERIRPLLQSGYLLDGFPRNLVQVQALEAANHEIDGVLLINVPHRELVRRLTSRLVCKQCQSPHERDHSSSEALEKCSRCGGDLYQRQDDTPEAVVVRVRVYSEETAPLVDYYTKAGKLLSIDGEGTVEEIARRLRESVRE